MEAFIGWDQLGVPSVVSPSEEWGEHLRRLEARAQSWSFRGVLKQRVQSMETLHHLHGTDVNRALSVG